MTHNLLVYWKFFNRNIYVVLIDVKHWERTLSLSLFSLSQPALREKQTLNRILMIMMMMMMFPKQTKSVVQIIHSNYNKGTSLYVLETFAC